MQNKFKIKADLPKTTQINKKLILSVGLLVAFVLIFAIVTAFSDKPTTTTDEPDVIEAQPTQIDQAPVVSDVIKKLPVDYQDTKTIKQFQQQTDKIPPEVQQELEFLKQQQVSLEQRLSDMRIKESHEPDRHRTNGKQAQHSGLFFSGTRPPSERYSHRPTTSDSKSKTSARPTFRREGSTSYSRQNMQEHKLKFLEPSDEAEDIYDLHNLTTPISPYEVQAGTLIPAVLITSVNTSLPGNAVAQVRQDIYDSVTGKFLLIPRGSKILGEYDSKVAYGQRRVLIAFTRVIRPDGTSILLSKYQGADLKGQAGMEGLVNNHWMNVLGAATLSTILSVGTGLASDRSADPDLEYPTAKQAAIMGAASAISQVGQNITNKAIDVQPTLVIPSGFAFNIIVRKDMVLDPFKRK